MEVEGGVLDLGGYGVAVALKEDSGECEGLGAIGSKVVLLGFYDL